MISMGLTISSFEVSYVLVVWQGKSPDARAGDSDPAGEAPPIRIGPSGRIETEEEYQARMAHNSYMRFSRSLRRTFSALVICVKI